MKYKAGNRRRAAEYEAALIKWWKENRTFEKSVEMRGIDNSYVFYDGPPFITGAPHYGTLLSSIVKDAVPRFWTMRGKRVERRWGWDCHGLPAENFVEKQLGITDRREIGTKWSLEEYINKARESMVANSATWEGVVDRVGRWVEFRGAYRTMDKDFMESVWWAFKTLYDKGLIYEGRKVLMYDAKFGTPVSKAEVTMDNDAYQNVTDPSAFVKFEVRLSNDESPDTLRAALAKSLRSGDSHSKVYLLAWTTTPWTLPANVMLAVKPEMEYGAYEMGDEVFILAASLAEKVLGENAKIVQKFKGSELVGLKYEPLIKNAIENPKSETYTVRAAEFVSDSEGTGIVHCAPAYGEDDYNLYLEREQAARIKGEADGGVDFLDALDDNGYYLPEMAEKLHALGVRDTDEHGIEAWAGNKFIAKVLEEAGIVWKIEYIQHEYPFNPRSKQRIMYRALPSWFFDIQGQKPLLLEKNEDIHWFPEHLKHGRFAKNIEQAPDWNLSRDRFWATAMPVWRGERTGALAVMGSYEELFEFSGKKLEDYHRPWVDEVEFDAKVVEKNGKKSVSPMSDKTKGEKDHFVRINKVLDCWFESGSMPFAQMHYPFENKEKFEANYPADFIVEYVGQVRAWFYYVHVVNTALFGEIAYKNVITTGTLAGNDGRKMSKSLGNYTDPNELMDKYSADSLRFLLLSSPVLSGEDFALTDKDVSDVARKLAMIWNVYDFFTTYASVDGFDSDEALKPADFKNVLDVWIVSRVHQLRDDITEGMEEYNIPQALDQVLPFVDDLSNWFVRRSRRRFWKSEDDEDKMEAYSALYYVLNYLARILAPFVPFLAEELYQKMNGVGGANGAGDSDGGASGPGVSEGGADGSGVLVGGANLPESVHLTDWPEAGLIDTEILEQMERTRAIITEGLALRMRKSETEEQIKVRQPLAKLSYGGPEKLGEEYEQMIAEEVNVKEVEWVKSGELELDKKLTKALREEGFARELIRVVQAARKKAGLNVDDRIRLNLNCKMTEAQLDMVGRETLAIVVTSDEKYRYTEVAKVNGEEVEVSLEKV